MSPRRIALAAATLALCVAGTSSATTLFGLVNTGELYASSDTATTWTIRSVLPVRDAVALAAGQTSSQLFLATHSGSLYRSTDAGLNWTGVAALTASDVAAMALRSNATVDAILLTESGSVYTVTGPSYATATSTGVITASDCVSLAFNGAGTLFALTRTGDVYSSANAGATWTAVGVITTSEARAIRTFGTSLFVITQSGDVYKSTNAGATWTGIGTLSHVGMTGFTVFGPYLIAGLQEGEAWTSPDGATWRFRGSINQVFVQALATDTPAVTGIGEGAGGGALAFAAPRIGGDASTVFTFTLPRNASVTLSAFDVRGRLVARRDTESRAAGENAVSWSPDVAPGVYRVRLDAGASGTAVAKWITLR